MHTDTPLELLIRSFSAELTPAEADVLAQWLAASEDNAREAAHYRRLWQESGAWQPEIAVDVDADFQKVLARIDKQPARTVSFQSYLLRAAAAVLLLAGAVWSFRQFTQSTDSMRTIVASVESQEVTLPDGSHIWLRKNARLEYPQSFEAAERRVSLDGEGFFEVTHRDKQPFRVAIADGGMVEVLGTRFGIRRGEASTVVLVKSGKVRYTPETGAKAVVLTAGKRAEFVRKARSLDLSAPASLNELAWQAGGLEFVDTPMRRVVADLSEYYHVQIELDNSALADCPVTAPLIRQPVEQVLASLSLTYQIKVEHPSPDRYVLRGGVCPN